MKPKKIVLPVAGLGTRLLPVTKEQPKEMLPIFTIDKNSNRHVTPIIQVIFEQLYSMGFRDFCFIVGKNKRIIKDHFSHKEHDSLNTKKLNQIKDLENFYKKIEDSNIVWINQSKPLGFGHAVLAAEPFVQNDKFILHAGDTVIWSKKNDHIQKLIDCHEKNSSSASFIVQEIKNPKHYGIVDGIIDKNFIHVKNLEEKPKKPKTNFAIMPVYLFESEIFDYIRKIKKLNLQEIQLTDGISKMVKDGHSVYALNLTKKIIQMDIGNPNSYWNSLKTSFNLKQNYW